jgi:protein arginine kinase activator
MKAKCDRCGRPASVYYTDIHDGQKIEKHLCEDCAVAEGITFKATMPISQLLEDFIIHASGEAEKVAELSCDVCGLTFAKYREQGLLGCPNDYDAFDSALRPLVERAQEGASQHVGKVPHRAGSSQKRQNAILRLRGELRSAIASENYERAAALRDQIAQLEGT